MNFSPNSPARMETPRCLFVAHVLVEVLYFTFVKPLQIEAGSSLSEKNQARHRRNFAGGEERPMFEGRVVVHDRTVRRCSRRIEGFLSKHPLLCPVSARLTND
jgi:hypothetical protein